jgi:hypothetical protein
MPKALALLVACFWSLPFFAQCGFVAEPVATPSWYRGECWQLPGITDGKITHSEVTFNGQAPKWPEGVTVSYITHDKNYRVSFPAAVFVENGISKVMQARTISLYRLLRWEVKGIPYAYTYDLWPEDVMCTFSVDVTDDRGDGIFRVMTRPGHTMEPSVTRDKGWQAPQPPDLPRWAIKPTA